MRRETKLELLLRDYRKEITRDHRPKHGMRIVRAIDGFFEHFTDRRNPEDIFVTDVVAWKKWKKRKGYGPRTIDFEVGCVRKFFWWLREVKNYEEHNPCNLKGLKQTNPIPNPLSTEEVQEILRGVRTPSEARFVLNLFRAQKDTLKVWRRMCLREGLVPLKPWRALRCNIVQMFLQQQGYLETPATYHWWKIRLRKDPDSVALELAQRTLFADEYDRIQILSGQSHPPQCAEDHSVPDESVHTESEHSQPIGH